MKNIFLSILVLLLSFEALMSQQNFYDLLGVSKTADLKEIKSAYRKLSQKYHPDKNQGNKDAQDLYMKINKAYETLTNPELKKTYDIYGEEGLNKEGQLSEQNKPRGHNAQVDVEVDLEELFNGATKSLNIQKNVICKHCHGTGGKLGQTQKCTKCNGRGQVVEDVDTGMGFTFKMQNVCSRCGGKGISFKEVCPHCRGRKVNREDKTITVNVEKGMKDGQKIVFPRESEQSPDTIPGDLIVTLKQKHHYFFNSRLGDDLYASINLNLKEALLGYNKTYRQLDGKTINISCNKPTQPFEVKVRENEGMPVHNYASNRGALHLKHIVRLPDRLTEEEKKIIEQIF